MESKNVIAPFVAEVAESKGLSTEAVYWALEEAIKKSFINQLKGGDGPSALASCHIDRETGQIFLAQLKKVTKEEDITDDFLEISPEEANEGLKKPKYEVGDYYEIPASLEECGKAMAMGVKNSFRGKLAEAERSALYEVYKDHIGEMVTGTVQSWDDRGAVIELGRNSIELSRREMIGDEFFKPGEPIKVYIQQVRQVEREDGKEEKPQIEVTRSSEGFLRRLFEEEIHEVYDGTVIIKGIAREAGVRSKVAVYSNNEDVDPTGSCIGPAGSRIQKVVGQLGNGSDKEKIDVIPYSENAALFVAESLRPCQVLGVEMHASYNDLPDGEDVSRHAIAVIRDGQSNVGIGRKGSNVRLANKLTGYHIDVVEESRAKEAGIDYTPIEQLREEAQHERKEKAKALYLEKSRREALKKAEQEAAAKKEEERIAEEKALEEKKRQEEAEKALAEERAREKAKKEAEEAVHVSVKTTTSLESLEKELEAAKEKKTVSQVTRKKPRKITEEEVERVKPSEAAAASTTAMPIYSDEELEEIEQEDSMDEDYSSGYDDIDIADYDRYYDDEK